MPLNLVTGCGLLGDEKGANLGGNLGGKVNMERES